MERSSASRSSAATACAALLRRSAFRSALATAASFRPRSLKVARAEQ